MSQQMDVEGTAEIISVTADEAGDLVSFYFTYANGDRDEVPIEGWELASIKNLPEGYQPNAGDKLLLKVELRFRPGRLAGPPHLWLGQVDNRIVTCLRQVDEK